MPCVIELRVVSLPATASVTTNMPNSASERRWPSASAWISVVTMSSPGFSRFRAANCMAYHINSPADGQRVVVREFRVVAADHLVGPVEQFVAVLLRHPEQPGDRLQRQLAATWRTKSPDPAAAASVAMRCARSLRSARSRSTARGVKPRETILRSRLCSGSSIMIIDARPASICPAAGPPGSAARWTFWPTRRRRCAAIPRGRRGAWSPPSSRRRRTRPDRAPAGSTRSAPCARNSANSCTGSRRA